MTQPEMEGSLRFRDIGSAIGLTLSFMALLLWPTFLWTSWPIALRCDPYAIRALYMIQAACSAAAADSPCVCLPIAQSIGYESLPTYIQAAEIAIVAILWSLYSRGPRRLLVLNAALGVAVLGVALFYAWTDPWGLLGLIYAPPIALAAVLLATLCFFVSSRLVALRARSR